MKLILFLCVSALMPICLYGKNLNTCITLANVISINQDRFDQAETALSDVDAICKDEAHPVACTEDLKKEYTEAKTALEKSQIDYKNAGCEL